MPSLTVSPSLSEAISGRSTWHKIFSSSFVIFSQKKKTYYVTREVWAHQIGLICLLLQNRGWPPGPPLILTIIWHSEKYTQMICQITFWIENDPPNPLRSADTLFWRFGAKLPIYKAGPFAHCDSVFNGQNRTRQFFCIHAQFLQDSEGFARIYKVLQYHAIQDYLAKGTGVLS